MSHIKNDICYKMGDKHNSRVKLKVKNSSSSPRPMFNKRRSKAPRLLIMFLILMLMVLMFLIYHIIILMLLMYL
jgi:cell division septal protein FtsQ